MAIPGNFLSPTTESVDPNFSGWATLSNCILSLGSGGRNGDGALAVKSLASGEMRARTAASYKVWPGETYHAFADASGATVPERIGIRWLDLAGFEISTTWSLTTSSASSSWHRISVGGTPPTAAAARAQVVLSASPAAANVTNLFENIYFGLPQRVAGNMLPWNSEGAEVSAADWTQLTSGPITRQAPVIQWNVDTYTAGGHVVALTASTAGNHSMRTTRVPCTPGVEYLGYCYINPPTSGSTCWVELRWYNTNGAFMSSTRATLAAPGTGWYRQRVSGPAPADATQVALGVGIDGATVGQVVRAEQAVITTAPVVTAAGSVVPYADASFEQGAAGWSPVSGPATIARSTPWGAQFSDGSYSLTVTSATASMSVLRSARLALGAAAGGANWRTQFSASVTAGGWTIRRRVRWYDAGGIEVGTSAGSAGAANGGGWWFYSNDFTAPTGAAFAEIEYELTATSAASVLQIDRVGLWPALPLIEVAADDDTARITLTLRELTTGDLITVSRVAANGERTVARGAAGLLEHAVLSAGLLVVEDYEAPLGAPVSYRVEVYDAATGELTTTRTSETVTLAAGPLKMCWIKDPAQPQRNVRLRAAQAPDWTRAARQTVYEIRGRRNPVVLSDVRAGLAGDLAVWTANDDERRALHFALDPDHTLLLQFPPGLGLDDMYVKVGEAQEPRLDGVGTNPRRRWILPLTQVDRPIDGTAGTAGWTVRDLAAAHPTVLEVRDRYATVLDLAFGRRKAS